MRDRARRTGRIGVGACLLAGVLVTASGAGAQTPQQPPPDPNSERIALDRQQQAHPAEPDWFLEPTYVAPMFGSRSPGAEGRPRVEIQSFHHVPMFPRQNSGRYQHWIAAGEGEPARRRQRFALTLGTIIRGHDGPSVPIQTPSIIFAGRYQYLRHKLLDDVSRITVLEGGIYHHSNGQDGCTFVEQTRIADECTPNITPAPDAWRLNTRDGSFGVNYLTVKAGLSRRHLDVKNGAGSREVITANSVQVEYRRYVTWIPGGSGIDLIAARFGRNEIDASWQPEFPSPWRPGQFRHLQLTFRGWRRFGSDAQGAGGAAAEIAWLGFAGGVAGPFVRAYRGSDYYNIRFDEDRRHVMVGLKWERSRLARLPAPVGTTLPPRP